MSLINQIAQRAKFGAIQGGRRVMLRGTTSLGWWFGDWTGGADSTVQRIVTDHLRAANFEVIAVRATLVSFFGAPPWPVNLEIELEVFCNHTSDEVRNNAITVIENATGRATSVSTSPSKIFYNTTLAVSYDQGCTNQPTQNSPAANPSAHDQTQSGNSDGWNSFWRGIGIATPPAVGTVALIGIAYLVISKRR